MVDARTHDAHTDAEVSWRRTYVLGAAVAIVAIGGTLFDIVLTMLPGWGTASVPATMAAWFAQFAQNPWLGVRNLDLLNITVSAITLPMFVAIFGAQRRTNPGLSLVALVFAAAGAVLFAANNAALPMLELSRRYATAASPADRAALLSAGQALLSRGAHGSYGAFLGFFVSEVGTLLASASMLRGRVFSPATAWIGVVGTTILTAYTVGITVMPRSSMLVMAAAMPGGLLMVAWIVMVARRLLRLAREG